MRLETKVKVGQQWEDNTSHRLARDYFTILRRKKGGFVEVKNYPQGTKSTIRLSRLYGMKNNSRGYFSND